MSIETQEPDVTLATTTETQAELDHATGPNWREPFTPPAKSDEAKPGDTTEKKDESKTAAASEAAKAGAKEGKSEDETEDDDKAPLPKGVQKRLDRLTARLKTAEEQLAAKQDRRSETTDKPAPKAATNADPEPQQKDFKSWEEFNAAHNRWIVRDENRKQQADAQQKAAADQSKANYDAHLERIEQGRADHEDFDDVVTAMPPFTFASERSNMAFQLAVVEAENGHEILYHLAQHPEEMEKFAGLSPVRVQMMVGRISAALSPSDAGTKPAPKTVTSRTPAPGTRLRSSSTATGNDIYNPDNAAKMTDEEWIRRRQADLDRKRNQRRN
jgi:hypothetical protein